MVAAVPPMTGANTGEGSHNLWRDMDQTFDAELAQSTLTVQAFLKAVIRREPGRASSFHLARESVTDPVRLPGDLYDTAFGRRQASASAAEQGHAGNMAQGTRTPPVFLTPVQRAAARLKAMVDGGEIYHPLRFNPSRRCS
jgi:hypothetical protein